MTTNIKFQISAALTFGVALILVWSEQGNETKIITTIFFLFPTFMLTTSLVERMVIFFKKAKKEKLRKIQKKLGILGNHQFTEILTELWEDKEFSGLGWEVYVNTQIRQAYLTHPCCYNCKTNLLARTNSKSNGFDLECTDCKKTFDVDDIGEKRFIANAAFQGEVRRNHGHYFGLF